MSSSSDMSVAGRDEILARFQDVTRIEDFDACVAYLEESHWNLNAAIEIAFASESNSPRRAVVNASEQNDEDSPILAGSRVPADTREKLEKNPFSSLLRDCADDELRNRAIVEADDDFQTAGSSYERRLLMFDVEYRNSNYHFSVLDDETIRDLKRYIAKEIFPDGDVSLEEISLRGWRDCQQPSNDTVLRTLHLPVENHLYAFTANRSQKSTTNTVDGENSKESQPSSARMYRLDIYDKDSDCAYRLNLSGDTSLGELKRQVYDLSQLMPSRQLWSGWPDAYRTANDLTVLSALKLDVPVHSLKVERAPSTAANTMSSEGRNSAAVNCTESDEEEEDHSNMMDISCRNDYFDESHDDSLVFSTSNNTRELQVPLMPAEYSSFEDAIENFVRIYESRYGPVHPAFCTSALDKAIRDTCHVKATERKPLLIYLHDDRSISAQVFATQVLSTQTVADFLNQNFTVWAWDCTVDENRHTLWKLLKDNLSSMIATEVRLMNRDNFPALLVVYKSRGTLEVGDVIRAPCSLDEFMGQLLHALEMFASQNRVDIAEEAEREARERVRSEQEVAYEASLAADRLKAEQKRLEQQKLLEDEKRQQEEAAQKEKEQQQLANELPPEPPAKGSVATIRLRLPNAEMLERRFCENERLATLFKFAASKGYRPEEYHLFTSYPKRDLTTMDPSKTLNELKLCPRETVVVEQKSI